MKKTDRTMTIRRQTIRPLSTAQIDAALGGVGAVPRSLPILSACPCPQVSDRCTVTSRGGTRHA